jgi:hypothetical protein
VHRYQRKHAHAPHIWIRWLMTLALLVLFVAPAVAAPPAPVDLPCAEVLWDAASGWPVDLRSCQFEVDPANSADDTARAFLQANHAALGLDQTLSSLRLASIRHGLSSSHVVYQQTLAGRPVYGAYLAVHLGDAGQVQVVQSRIRPDLRLETATPALTAVEAVQQARLAIEFAAPRANSPAPELVVLPMSDRTARLAWRVLISAAQPQGDWEVLLDAISGQVIKRYNHLALARGQILDPSAAPPARAAALPLRTLPLQGLDDSGWLRGDYVDVTQPVGYRPATAFSPSGDFLYQPDDPRFKEVMVYYHIDAAQRYIQSLGYSDDNQPPNGIRDRVTIASPHWFSQDQSFYSVSDDALHFGDGGWPDAMDPDIIVHEYGHALLYDLAPHWGGGEMAAIGEGFGDYLAASLFGATSADPACIGEWDSRAGRTALAGCLRRVDGNHQYPNDVTGDVHSDGALWSRVLWDVRAAVGQKTADVLALESSFYLPPAATLVEAGQALLDADANLFAGQHRAAIMQALQARGLASLPAPLALVAPARGAFLTPGGLAPVVWQGQADLPVDYDLEWSANASAAGLAEMSFDGDLAEEFEAMGSAPWQVVEGAARSGRIEHGQHSSLALSLELMAAGQISFRYQVDAEQGYDGFEFLVDGEPLLRASGQSGWRTFAAPLPAGQHQLIWRFSKDGTLSSGQDAAWIDDLRVENASLAQWQPAELVRSGSTAGGWMWRVPNEAASNASLRVRARLGAAASQWTVGAPFAIDQPTAVSLAGFEAGVAQTLTGPAPLLVAGLVGLLGGLTAGRRLLVRRRRQATTPPILPPLESRL